jgi:hypothetical protein
LTLHADRGGPMKAKATAFLLADLGVTKSHSTVLAVLGKFVAFSMAYIVTLRISKCMIFQEDSAKLPRQC